MSLQWVLFFTGALYKDFTGGRDKIDDAVPPGGAVTYTWYVTNNHAPLKDDDNCVVWGYHSHTVAPRDIDTGLIGMLLTCRPGKVKENRIPFSDCTLIPVGHLRCNAHSMFPLFPENPKFIP